MKRSDTEISDFNLPTQLIDLFTKHVRELNVMPEIAMKAIAIADQDDADYGTFIDLIVRDLQLTSNMLRRSNSPLFGLQHKVSSLDQAAKILGFRQCKNLILTTCISSLMKDIPLQEEWVREILGSHSLTTASLAQQLSQRYQLGFGGDEFTAGLIHDIGRTLFAALLPSRFSELDPLEFIEGPDLLEQETKIAGTNHAELGAYFAVTNNFPDSLVDVARYHHHPRSSVDHTTLVAVVAAADHVSNYLQLDERPTDYMPEENDGILILDEIVGCGIYEDFSNSAESIIAVTKAESMESTLAVPT